MAQFRQSGGDRFAGYFGNGADAGGGGGGGYGRGQYKGGRLRRHGKGRKFPIGAVVVILALVLVVTFFSFGFISGDSKENEKFPGQDDDDIDNDLNFLSHSRRAERYKVLKFGRGSVIPGRDSRYWDRDDRRRDKGYDGDTSEIGNEGQDKVENLNPKNDKNGNKKPPFKHQLSSKTTGLYNEIGRDELKHYEAEYETSLKNLDRSSEDHKDDHPGLHNMDMDLQNEADPFDEYDDGMDLEDSHEEESENKKLAKEENEPENVKRNSILGVSFSKKVDKDKPSPNADSFPLKATQGDNAHDETTKKSAIEKKSDTRRKVKRRKFSSSSCEMKFLNSTAQLVEPIQSRKFKRFQLHYTEVEDRPNGEENWRPKFAGHQSLQEREESFYARDQKLNCGFVKGPQGYPSTGFDLAEDDMRYMKSCHVAVSSCIFGNSDNLRSPTNKAVTRLSRKNVCFVIFVDEKTLETLSSEGQSLDRTGFIGLWKVVVVQNLPYDDMRRVGKIPKFLTHRLFPSARYSIWLDSKLRLQSDPLLILEYFLWRKNFEYAISNHYDRHCVWEEVMQNKKLNKFNHTIIDQQFEFYKADGLKKFNASDPDRVLPSNVPEGSFIVRAHTPMSNLFSCLWFNEVERFTPRDQLSFAYTYIKLRRMNPEKPFYLNMFKDCERRSIAKLYRHRPEDKRNLPVHATE